MGDRPAGSPLAGDTLALEGAGRAGRSAASRSALVTALALPGDALLYLVLPVEAAAFGLSPVWVGVLLSANRFVRPLANVLLVPVAQRVGLAGLAAAGAAAAAVSTLGYGLFAGGIALLAMRLVWGTAYSALRLAQLGYATGTASRVGGALGRSHAISQLGPLLAVTGGVALVDRLATRPALVVIGLVSVLGLAVARSLPSSAATGVRPSDGGRCALVPRPDRADVAIFGVTLATDGILMATLTALLVQEGYGAEAAIRLGGFVLVLRRAAALVAGPVAGSVADRYGLPVLFRGSLVALAAGFVAVATGAGLTGLVAVATVVPVVQALAPGLATRDPAADRLHRLASFTTWSDLGAAVGALAGGSLGAWLDLELLYLAGAVLVLAAVPLTRPPR